MTRGGQKCHSLRLFAGSDGVSFFVFLSVGRRGKAIEFPGDFSLIFLFERGCSLPWTFFESFFYACATVVWSFISCKTLNVRMAEGEETNNNTGAAGEEVTPYRIKVGFASKKGFVETRS